MNWPLQRIAMFTILAHWPCQPGNFTGSTALFIQSNQKTIRPTITAFAAQLS
jgi:hypothetical protein